MHYYQKMEKNVGKNYIFTFLSNFNLTSVIWVIFLAYKGMSLTEIGLLEGIFHVTSFFMEVPTGAVADIFGRKTSRILGKLTGVISNIIFISSGNFWLFALSMFVTALSYNLESGAGQALVYDSLLSISKEKKYLVISGRIEFITQTAMFLGYIAGGYFAGKSFETAYIIAIIIGVVNFLYAFSFTEPEIEYKNEIKGLKGFFIQNRDSFNEIKKNKKLLFVIMFSEFASMVCTTVFFYLQNYMYSEGFTTYKIGLILALAGVAGAVFGLVTHKIEKVLSEKGILMLLPLIMAISLIFMGISEFSYIFFIFISAAESVIFVAYSDYVNRNIPSDKRATILSMCSMVFSMYMIFIFPLVGKLGDIYGLKLTFLLLGIGLFILSSINIVILFKSKK
ncbi:MAG TPA: MFS transporter [Tepiditoga sp.]|nr:MFS transporter [Tepiditoga sp.]